MKEQYSSHLRKIGVCLHQHSNLRNENLLSTPVRQCIWSAKRTWVMLKLIDTLTKSCSPTIVITANGEVQTHEEATVYVKEFGYIRDYESPRKHASSIIARKGLRWKRIFLWMDQWSKNHISLKDGIRIMCNTENFVPIVVPGLSNSSSWSDSSTSRTLSRQGVIARHILPARLRHLQ